MYNGERSLTTMTFSLKFQCEDKYEAEKLASLIATQKDNTLMVAGMLQLSIMR